MNRIGWITGGLALIAVAACGPKDGEENLEPLSEANAQAAGQLLAGQIETTITDFGTDFSVDAGGGFLVPEASSWGRPALRPMEAVAEYEVSEAALDCHTVTGDESDADGDGIPADMTITYNCSESSNGLTLEMSGSVTVRDTAPDEVSFNFEYVVDNLHVRLSSDGESIDINQDGSLTASTDGSTYNADKDMTMSLSGTDSDGEPQHIEMGVDWVTSFTPDGTWSIGDLMVGDVTVDGGWRIRVNDEGASMNVATDPNVHVDEDTCASGVDAGALKADWQNGSEQANLEVSWSGCGTYEVNYTESGSV